MPSAQTPPITQPRAVYYCSIFEGNQIADAALAWREMERKLTARRRRAYRCRICSQGFDFVVFAAASRYPVPSPMASPENALTLANLHGHRFFARKYCPKGGAFGFLYGQCGDFERRIGRFLAQVGTEMKPA